jgi:hypothetical protein
MRQLAAAFVRMEAGKSTGKGVRQLAAALKALEPSPAAKGMRQLAAALQRLNP